MAGEKKIIYGNWQGYSANFLHVSLYFIIQTRCGCVQNSTVTDSTFHFKMVIQRFSKNQGVVNAIMHFVLLAVEQR